MKALSLKQPWAELVVSGKKTIELRKWNTNFRGKFLIHASMNPDMDAMKRFGFESLPLGFIIGEAELFDVKEYKDDNEFQKDKPFHLAFSDWGNYDFLLKNTERISPIKIKGNLGFWEFKPLKEDVIK